MPGNVSLLFKKSVCVQSKMICFRVYLVAIEFPEDNSSFFWGGTCLKLHFREGNYLWDVVEHGKFLDMFAPQMLDQDQLVWLFQEVFVCFLKILGT